MATERIPQGGALTVYNPMAAAQGFYRDPRASYNYMAGVVGQTFNNIGGNQGQKVTQATQQVRQGALFNRNNMLGGALLAAPGVVMGAQDVAEGRLLEGGITAGGSALSAAGGMGVARRVGGAKGALLGLGITGLGTLASAGLGEQAERAKAGATGQEIAGREGSDSARRGRTKKDAQMDMDIRGQAMDQNLSFLKQAMGMASDQQFLDLQRNMPLVEKMKNNEMTRMQTLMNTQGQNYAMLGTLATAGKLATGAQAETGATLRTAMTSNPYSNSTLQAPSISF